MMLSWESHGNQKHAPSLPAPKFRTGQTLSGGWGQWLGQHCGVPWR